MELIGWHALSGTGAIVLIAIVLALVAAVVLHRRWARRHAPRSLPFLVFDTTANGRAHVEPALWPREAPPSTPAPPAEPALAEPALDEPPPARVVRAERPPEPAAVAEASQALDDCTLQLLPGRLVPVNGTLEQEIRFVRTPGVSRFTLGRSPGEERTHVQLRAPTASRMHAYLVFEGDRWLIGNLSSTNPVVVNGVALGEENGARWLADGDRVELGEVAFTFRER